MTKKIDQNLFTGSEEKSPAGVTASDGTIDGFSEVFTVDVPGETEAVVTVINPGSATVDMLWSPLHLQNPVWQPFGGPTTAQGVQRPMVLPAGYALVFRVAGASVADPVWASVDYAPEALFFDNDARVGLA